MRKSKKIISSLLLFLFTFLLLINNNYSDNAFSATQKKVVLRFMWWGGDARHKATLSAISAFTKKYPYIRINGEYGGYDGYFQKLVTQLVSKTAPDIIQIDAPWIPELNAQGDFFVDLKSFKEINTSYFDANFLKNFCFTNNKLIGLPTGVNAYVLQYNRDFFKKYGLNENTEWTWNNILTTAEKIHKKDKNVYLLNSDAQICYFMLKAYITQKTGGQWINDNYTLGFDRKTLIEGFDYFGKLFDVGGIQPFSQSAPFQSKPEQNTKWLRGEMGMLWNWISTYSPNKSNLPSLSMTMIPIFKNAKNTGVIVRPSQLLTVNKYSKNEKEAARFLNWFLNDKDASKILGDVRGVPASSIAREALIKANKLDPLISEITDKAVKKAGKPENSLSQNQEIEKLSMDVIQQFAYKQLNSSQAADKLISLYTQKLSELKNQRR